jgi:glycosyltransferase involved in cell wall biosynthesis
MQSLITTPELRNQLGRHGKERVQQSFDWEKKIDRILEIYLHVAPKAAVEALHPLPV